MVRAALRLQLSALLGGGTVTPPAVVTSASAPRGGSVRFGSVRSQRLCTAGLCLSPQRQPLSLRTALLGVLGVGPGSLLPSWADPREVRDRRGVSCLRVSVLLLLRPAQQAPRSPGCGEGGSDDAGDGGTGSALLAGPEPSAQQAKAGGPGCGQARGQKIIPELKSHGQPAETQGTA